LVEISSLLTTTEIMPRSLMLKFFAIVACDQHRSPMKNTLAPSRPAEIAMTVPPWPPAAAAALAAVVVVADGSDETVADMTTEKNEDSYSISREQKKRRCDAITKLENTISKLWKGGFLFYIAHNWDY
jgi:hypothetical protein